MKVEIIALENASSENLGNFISHTEIYGFFYDS